MTSHGISATRHRSSSVIGFLVGARGRASPHSGLLHCVATLRVHYPAMTPPLGRLSEGPDGRG